MKANEAPEKIYVHEASAPELTEKLPYHLEYIRKDAFMKKACEWLKNNLQGVVGGNIYIDDFRKYMEGE